MPQITVELDEATAARLTAFCRRYDDTPERAVRDMLARLAARLPLVTATATAADQADALLMALAAVQVEQRRG